VYVHRLEAMYIDVCSSQKSALTASPAYSYWKCYHPRALQVSILAVTSTIHRDIMMYTRVHRFLPPAEYFLRSDVQRCTFLSKIRVPIYSDIIMHTLVLKLLPPAEYSPPIYSDIIMYTRVHRLLPPAEYSPWSDVQRCTSLSKICVYFNPHLQLSQVLATTGL
jgi:hypothetical protein